MLWSKNPDDAWQAVKQGTVIAGITIHRLSSGRVFHAAVYRWNELVKQYTSLGMFNSMKEAQTACKQDIGKEHIHT